MPKFGYLVVEGPYDVEFAYRLMRPFGLTRIQYESELDAFFSDLVPRSFPHGGDLQKRVPVPLFLQSKSHAIAIHNAIGDTRLVQTVEENAAVIDYKNLTGVGVILDSDNSVPALQRFETIKTAMAAHGFNLPDAPGFISQGTPKYGAFVLPDNESNGNLEDLLIDCASVAFPNLLTSARTHVENARDDTSFQDGKREDLTRVQNFNKAVVGSIAKTLRPGRAVQTSIQDNIWLRGENLTLPRVKAVQDFLADLFELTVPE